MTLYFVVTFLGASALTILLMLYLSRRDSLLRYMLAGTVLCLAMIIINAVMLQMNGPYKGYDGTAIVAALYFEITSYLFVLFWIITMGNINGGKNLIPSRILPLVFAACFGVRRIWLFSGSDDVSLIASLILDAVIITNGMYFVVCGIRNKEGRFRSGILIASGIALAAYGAQLIYADSIVHRKMTEGGAFVSWPYDFTVFLMIVFEVIVLSYFFYADPMNIWRKDARGRKGHDFRKAYDLTERESEIAELILMGLSNPEIAEKIFIAEATVKKHLTSIYRKTETNSRYDLIVKLENK